jgi:hypothetical protein
MPQGNITDAWREPFTNDEIHALHAAPSAGATRERPIRGAR